MLFSKSVLMVCVVQTVAVISMASGNETRKASLEQAVKEFVSTLKSPALQKLAESAGRDLAERDAEKSTAAVDIFTDLKAKPVLLVALGKVRNDTVKLHIVKDLLVLSTQNDREVVGALLDELRTSNLSTYGGTEAAQFRANYVRSILQALAGLTSLNLPTANTLTEEDFRMAVDSVEKWIEKTQVGRRGGT